MHDALHDALASGGHTGFALAAINLEAVLEVAEFPVGLPVIAQARSAGFDAGDVDVSDVRSARVELAMGDGNDAASFFALFAINGE